MTRSACHPWLDRFAWLTAGATFLLLGLGGLVTSHEAGLAVPDWPTTYGYNMFLFPVHFWRYNILYEHTHRLFASFVGLLTIILAVWLWLREPRSWMRRLGAGAFFVILLQGLLGGFRVTLLKDEIGIFHATLAQSFFVLVTLIALFCSGKADKFTNSLRTTHISNRLFWLTIFSASLVLIQLILGATMRHQHAGIAVPDFPLAYGKAWPPMDAAFLLKANSQRLGTEQLNPITAFQIGLQMAHRLVALSLLLLVGCLAWKVRREQGAGSLPAKLAAAWLWLNCLQAVLGAATIWSNKAADVAVRGGVKMGQNGRFEIPVAYLIPSACKATGVDSVGLLFCICLALLIPRSCLSCDSCVLGSRPSRHGGGGDPARPRRRALSCPLVERR